MGIGDTITINISESQYNNNKVLFDSLGAYDSDKRYYGSYHSPEYMLRCNKTDFEIEYIK